MSASTKAIDIRSPRFNRKFSSLLRQLIYTNLRDIALISGVLTFLLTLG